MDDDRMDSARWLVRSRRLGWGAVLAVVFVLATGCGGDNASDDNASGGSVDGDAGAQTVHTHDADAQATSEVRVARAEGSPTTLAGQDLVHCIATAEQTGGSYSFLEIYLPGGSGPPLHQHPSDEWFYVISGAISFEAGDVNGDVGPGDYFHIPRDTTHTIRATTPTRLLAGYAPGGEEGRLFCPT